MKILDMLFTEVGVPLVSKAVVLLHRIELLDEEERERTTPIVAFDYGVFTQENEDTFSIRDNRCSLTGATCWSHSILDFISGRFHQRSWLSQDHFEM